MHGYFNARSEQNIQLRNDDGDVSEFGMLAVFMHVPRTSGDSMKTHMFNDAALDSSGDTIWPSQYNTLSKLRPLRSFLFDEDLATISSMESTRAVVKGFFSAQDLTKIKKAAPHREVKTIVFLRHPLERFLSFYAMIKPYANLPNEETYSWTAEEFAALVFNDLAMIEKMPKKYRTNVWNRKGSWGCTFLNNSMAWQLGYQQHCEARLDSHLSDSEVVKRAKDTLKAADFVGFYENLDVDFSALRREIFHEEYMCVWKRMQQSIYAYAFYASSPSPLQKLCRRVPFIIIIIIFFSFTSFVICYLILFNSFVCCLYCAGTWIHSSTTFITLGLTSLSLDYEFKNIWQKSQSS